MKAEHGTNRRIHVNKYKCIKESAADKLVRLLQAKEMLPKQQAILNQVRVASSDGISTTEA